MESLFTKNHSFALIEAPYDKSDYLKSFNCVNSECILDDISDWPECFGIESSDEIIIYNNEIKDKVLSEKSTIFFDYIIELKNTISTNLSYNTDQDISDYIFKFIKNNDIYNTQYEVAKSNPVPLPNSHDFNNWFVILNKKNIDSEYLNYLTNNFQYYTYFNSSNLPQNTIVLLNRREVYIKCWKKIRLIKINIKNNIHIISVFNTYINLEFINFFPKNHHNIRICKMEK